ncbi:hypothetical protein K9M79_05755 [Candidatus Woesearchaeota archaeon]|nr:hypothetical protein [Candidatus Woesearchaeota archaeon]
MTRLRKLAALIAVLGVLYSTNPAIGASSRDIKSASTTTASVQANAKKKAVLFCAGSYKNGTFDPSSPLEGTKNTYQISLANIYHDLKGLGYSPENIRVFYHDGTMDMSENRDKDKIDTLVREQFNNRYDNEGTLENLESVLSNAAATVNPDDEFVFYLTNHAEEYGGEPKFQFDNPKYDSIKTVGIKKIKTMLKKIKSKSQTHFYDFCDSKGFAEASADIGAASYASGGYFSPSLRSRAEQFGRFVINAWANPKADLNGDGTTTQDEAFAYAQQQRKPFLEEHQKQGHFMFYEMSDFTGYKMNTKNRIAR